MKQKLNYIPGIDNDEPTFQIQPYSKSAENISTCRLKQS
jgi:hypothetical protein